MPLSFKNKSDRAYEMLISLSPAGLEQMFFETEVRYGIEIWLLQHG